MLKNKMTFALSLVAVIMLVACVPQKTAQQTSRTPSRPPVPAGATSGKPSATTCAQFVEIVRDIGDDYEGLTAPSALYAGYLASRNGSDLVSSKHNENVALDFAKYCKKIGAGGTLASYANKRGKKVQPNGENAVSLLSIPCDLVMRLGREENQHQYTVAMNWLAGYVDLDMMLFKAFESLFLAHCLRDPNATTAQILMQGGWTQK